jgi:hypothetical protein
MYPLANQSIPLQGPVTAGGNSFSLVCFQQQAPTFRFPSARFYSLVQTVAKEASVFYSPPRRNREVQREKKGGKYPHQQEFFFIVAGCSYLGKRGLFTVFFWLQVGTDNTGKIQDQPTDRPRDVHFIAATARG